MKRPVSLFLAIAAGCWISALPAPVRGESLHVVTSVIPLAYIVEELGGARVKTRALAPPGASPHTFEPVPSDLRRLAGAHLFVAIGGGFDAWSDRLLEAAPKEIEAVRLIGAPNLRPLEGEDHHHDHGKAAVKGDDHHDHGKAAGRDHEHHDHGKAAGKEHQHHGHERAAVKGDDHHDHGKAARKDDDHHSHEQIAGKDDHRDHGEEALDPHFWLDPVRVRDAVVPVLVQRLIAADPAGRDYYEKRRHDFHERLTALDQEIRTELGKTKKRKYIAFHAAWPYFAERYGLERVAVVQEFAGEEPTPREIARLVRDAHAAGVRAILVEPQLNPRVAQNLAAEFGAGTLLVDPLGDPGDPARDTYAELMQFNARAFARALQGKGH